MNIFIEQAGEAVTASGKADRGVGVGVSRQRSGFMLIELSAALFVATVGAFGAMHLYMLSLDRIRAISEYETALCVLNNEIETLRALPYDGLETGDGLPFHSETPAIERLRLAETTVRIEDIGDGTLELKRVAARVRWIGEHGRRIEKELVTIITRKETGHE